MASCAASKVQPVPCDELVDDVEVLSRLPVHLDDGTVADDKGWLGVVWAAHRDQAKLRVGNAEAVEVHRFRVEDTHPPQIEIPCAHWRLALLVPNCRLVVDNPADEFEATGITELEVRRQGSA